MMERRERSLGGSTPVGSRRHPRQRRLSSTKRSPPPAGARIPLPSCEAEASRRTTGPPPCNSGPGLPARSSTDRFASRLRAAAGILGILCSLVVLVSHLFASPQRRPVARAGESSSLRTAPNRMPLANNTKMRRVVTCARRRGGAASISYLRQTTACRASRSRSGRRRASRTDPLAEFSSSSSMARQPSSHANDRE